jgi:hypothetical protein
MFVIYRVEEERKLYKFLVGKPEGKRPLGRPRRRWEDGIKMDLGETGLGMWIGFDWLRTGLVAGCCECGDEPSGSCATELVGSSSTKLYFLERKYMLTLKYVEVQ